MIITSAVECSRELGDVTIRGDCWGSPRFLDWTPDVAAAGTRSESWVRRFPRSGSAWAWGLHCPSSGQFPSLLLGSQCWIKDKLSRVIVPEMLEASRRAKKFLWRFGVNAFGFESWEVSQTEDQFPPQQINNKCLTSFWERWKGSRSMTF